MAPDPHRRAAARGPAGARRRLVELSLVGGVVYLFAPVLLGGRVFYEWDIHLLWHSQVEIFRRTLLAGELPLWNRWYGFGTSLISDGNMQIFYPLAYLSLLVPPAALHGLVISLHVLLGGWGMSRLARELGATAAGSALAAWLWIASGPVLSMVTTFNHMSGLAWMPWVVWSFVRLLRSPSGGRLVAAGLIGALQMVAGSPDMVVYTHVALLFLLPLWIVRRRAVWSVVVLLLCSYGLLLLLSAGTWLPGLVAAGRSVRSLGAVDEGSLQWTLHPLTLMQLIAPLSIHRLPLDQAARDLLYGGRNPMLASIYLGPAPLVLAVLALVGGHRRLRWCLGALALTATALALGDHTPVWAWGRRLLPPLALLRYSEKAMFPAFFGLTLLAGLGLTDWSRRAPRRGALALFALLGAVVVAVTVWAAAVGPTGLEGLSPLLAGVGEPLRQQLDRTLPLMVVSALALAALPFLRWRKARLPATAVLLGLTLAPPILHHRGLNRTASPTLYRYRPEVLDHVRADDHRRLYSYWYRNPTIAAALLGRRDAYRLAPPMRDALGFSLGRAIGALASLRPPSAARWGLEGSFDPDYMQLQPVPVASWCRFVEDSVARPFFPKLLRMGAVSHFVALHRPSQPGFRSVAEIPSVYDLRLRVFEVVDPLPRAYAVSGIRSLADREAPGVIVGESFDPTREAIVAGGASSRPPAPDFVGRVQLRRLAANRVELEARVSAPALVVLVDAYDPDWEVWVDGRRAPLLRANVAYRAVEVPPGHHRIVFSYRPWSAGVALALMVTGLVLSLGALGHHVRAGGAPSRWRPGASSPTLRTLHPSLAPKRRRG